MNKITYPSVRFLSTAVLLAYMVIASPSGVHAAAPNAPSISGPITGKTTISYTYTFTATDPDADKVRYGVDWDHDGVVDEWVPAVNYVGSGVSTSTTHAWNTIGTKNIQALTEDNTGISSGWTQYTITISTLTDPPSALISVSPGSIPNGATSTITYTCSNGTSAAITPTPGTVTPATGGTTIVSPSITTQYTLTCANGIGTTTSQETITVTKPNLQAYDITTLDTLETGRTITWRLYVSNELASAANNFLTTMYICPKTDTACINASFALRSGSIWGKVLAFITVHTAHAATYPVVLVSSPMSLAGYTWNWTSVTSGTTDFGASGGQFNLIVCADNNGSKVGSVTETYENDNCQDRTFTIVQAPPIASACDAKPTVLPDTGGVVTYDADPSGVSSAPYSWVSSDGQGGPYGSSRITTRAFTSTDKDNPYGMSVTPNGESSKECPVVIVGTVCGGTPTGTLTATPARVRSGTAPSLSVGIVSHVPVGETCVVTGPGYTSDTIPSNNCSTDPVKPITPTPPAITTQTVYKLMCDGIQADDLIVNVIPAFKEF